MKESIKKKRIDYIVKVGIFAALSAALYQLKFPLPFLFPGFLKIQFSNLPVVIGGFVMGPLGGVLILIIKTLISLPISESMCVGEIADFIIGLAVVLTSSLIYKNVHTKRGGEVALVFGSLAWIIVAVIANYVLLVPFYIWLYCDNDIQTFLAGCAIIPGINENNYMLYYILIGAIPFNMLISIVVNVVTFFTYKKISTFIRIRDNNYLSENDGSDK